MISRDTLNLKQIYKYQTKDKVSNVLNSMTDEQISRIHEWFNSLSNEQFKKRIERKIAQQINNLPDRFDTPSEFLSCIWEMYVASELERKGCKILDYDVESHSGSKKPDLLVLMNGTEFVVECKLRHGSQLKHDEKFRAGEEIVDLISKGAIREAQSKIEFKTVDGRALEDFVLSSKEEASQQTKSVDRPAILALCNVNQADSFNVGPGEIPDRFVDPIKLAEPEGNIFAIWHCANHFIWWPEHTKNRSFVLYDGDTISTDFKAVIQTLDLGRDLSELIEGFKYSLRLKPAYDEIQKRLWHMQVNSVMNDDMNMYECCTTFQQWLNEKSSTIRNSCLSHFISLSVDMIQDILEKEGATHKNSET